jgi:RNA polymerase sigma-70 factor, ECF subfamily
MSALAAIDRYKFGEREVERSPMVADTRADLDGDRAGRFRDLALPHLDDLSSFARYLLGNATDADDAVQECYLRAYRHFDSYRGPQIKPWLIAILRNVCIAARARKAAGPLSSASLPDDIDEAAVPVWSEAQETPEGEVLRRHDDRTIRGLVEALPATFREVIVLREIDDLSYREIAEIIDVPVGTVMSRLARARAMLREAWLQADAKEVKT